MSGTRLLMTTDTVGGVWDYSVALCSQLASSGLRILLAAFGPPLSSERWREVQSIPGLEVAWRDLKLCWMSSPWDDVRIGRDWLGELERRFGAELVHVNTLEHAARAWRVPVLTVGHSCVLSWHHAVRGVAAGEEWSRYRDEVRAGLRRSDLVVAPTRAMLKELRRHYGAFSCSRVIHNGLPHRRRYSRTKEPLVLAAGRVWDEAKNTAALARIAGALAWPVVVAGEDQHPDGGAVTWRSVSMLGRIERSALDEWYERAAIFAHPARYEPFGLTPLEAARAECALVLGDIPTLRELWRDAALFVAPDDDRALSGALGELIRDDRARQDFQARAARRARQLTLDAAVRGYLAAYRALVRGRQTAELRP
jgi:glycogen synthase